MGAAGGDLLAALRHSENVGALGREIALERPEHHPTARAVCGGSDGLDGLKNIGRNPQGHGLGEIG
jgi:hypothetical protein